MNPSLHDLIDYQRNASDQTTRLETFIRIKVWWAFNDRIRRGELLFEDSTEEDFWSENTYSLIKLLKLDFNSNLIHIAELYRNLGQFEMCRDIILKSSVRKGIMDTFLEQCDKKNRFVFELI